MNNNAIAGIVIGAVIVIGGIAFFMYGSSTPVPEVTSGTPAAPGGAAGGSVTTTTISTTTVQGVVPVAHTSAATVLTRSSAKMNGQVTPQNTAAAYWFEYGETTSLGSSTPILSAGNGGVPEVVSQSVSGLKPLTTYYFRLNAQNMNGTTNGTVLSFTTL